MNPPDHGSVTVVTMRTLTTLGAALAVAILPSLASAKFPPPDHRELTLNDRWTVSLDGASTGGNGVQRWASFSHAEDVAVLRRKYRRKDKGERVTYRARIHPRHWRGPAGAKARLKARFDGHEVTRFLLRVRVKPKRFAPWPIPGTWTEHDVTDVRVTPAP